MNIKYPSKHNHLLYNYYLWATIPNATKETTSKQFRVT